MLTTLRHLVRASALTVTVFGSLSLSSQTQPPPRYETRANHSPNGAGTFFTGKETAQVMDPGNVEWLDRAHCDTEEYPWQVLDAQQLHPGEVGADLGAGSGYFNFRRAPKVGPTGKMLGVNVQDELLETLKQRATAGNITNLRLIKASATDPHLPTGVVYLVLFVDVYHELAYPYEVMQRVRESLKPDGRVAFTEDRREDPITTILRMSVAQLDKEMAAVGLVPFAELRCCHCNKPDSRQGTAK